MRTLARYPVDRYLVESSNKIEMVNILDDDTWNPEPALKPEDEILLKKLHDTLQSTADDLKLLSGELSKYHAPGVQVKSTPTPLDEEFNEKVHIEEIVNAKFHGYKIIDKTPAAPEDKAKKKLTDYIKPTVNLQNQKGTNVPVNTRPVNKKPTINRNLGITRTNIIQINGNTKSTKTEKLNNGREVSAPTVAEYSYKYVEPKLKTPSKNLQIQEMPSINIRSELKEQKVLQLDILPDIKESDKPEIIRKNVAVVAIDHDTPNPLYGTDKRLSTRSPKVSNYPQSNIPTTTRKVSKMSAFESSGSINNTSSDTQVKISTQKRILKSIRSSPKTSVRNDRKKSNKKESEKRVHLNLDEWRKKLNTVYGTSSTKKVKSPQTKGKAKTPLKKTNIVKNNYSAKQNNLEYIPYSKLTVGGARASDIERELSDISNKRDIPLSPIVDRILSSRENSFSKNSSQKHKPKENLNILTTSDENLLQEVIEIEKTVSDTLSKNINNTNKVQKTTNEENHDEVDEYDSDKTKENDSYADDFEEEKSDHSGQSGKDQETYSTHSNKDPSEKYNSSSENADSDNDEHNNEIEAVPSSSKIQNLTYTKLSNLSFKNQVDIFEFVHSVDVQDSATQSNTGKKITPKETQTSPINDRNLQPIHNDLWPTIDPKGEVEKMFQLEKEFIKKLVVEEYGDLLEKNIDKPSTSKAVEMKLNVAASQKNTQTSPAHVKNVMTSPTRTKTRTTSPMSRLTVDHHTSPLILVVNEDDIRLDVDDEDDPGISINLSSPRFSLRLPRTSREVISNLEDSAPRTVKKSASNTKRVSKSNITTTSSSSMEADSSEISSLGEIRLRRKLGRTRIISDSDSVTSSCISDLQSGILPLRSEGEMSLGRNKKSNKQSRSEGEASFGPL
uniref:Uncharacterized protein n=1 Tax=Heliothis virescens TaxID=7102 RepID=A0A2A4K1P6_HELVI